MGKTSWQFSAMTNRIEELRKTKGIRQRDLAQLADVDPSHLSKIENGHTEPKLGTADRIAVALDEKLGAVFEIAAA